jgi:hypothetical protein
MKRRVKEMEEEAAKLREMQAQVEKEMGASTHERIFFPLNILRIELICDRRCC